jgi:hypothetical protein
MIRTNCDWSLFAQLNSQSMGDNVVDLDRVGPQAASLSKKVCVQCRGMPDLAHDVMVYINAFSVAHTLSQLAPQVAV